MQVDNTISNLSWYFHQVVFFSTLGGRKQAERISKMIQSCKHRIKKLHAQYVELQRENGEGPRGTIEDVCNLQSHFWNTEHVYTFTEPHENIPPSLQRRLIELARMQQRTVEEKQLLIAESIWMVEFYNNCLHSWNSHLNFVQCLQEDIHDVDLSPNEADLYLKVGSIVHDLPCQSAGLIAVALMNCQLLHFKLQRIESIVCTLVRAYWSADMRSQSLLASTRKQCRPDILPIEPLYMGVLQSTESSLPWPSEVVSSDSGDDVSDDDVVTLYESSSSDSDA